MAGLLSARELPAGFTYPRSFVRVVELGLTNLEPWWILEDKLLRERYKGLRKRYPSRRLVPFARRQDNDDLACFDAARGHVVVIHDFASPGWEQRAEFSDFSAWLHEAIDELMAFE